MRAGMTPALHIVFPSPLTPPSHLLPRSLSGIGFGSGSDRIFSPTSINLEWLPGSNRGLLSAANGDQGWEKEGDAS